MYESPGVLLAIGGNQPLAGMSMAATLRAALAELSSEGIDIVAESSLYQTPCFPAGAGPDYLNGAVRVNVPQGVDAAATLAGLHRIEAALGRTREIRWGARIVDLDLLAFGDIVAPDASTWDQWYRLPPDRQRIEAPNQLILPHPRMQDRAFVLVPLAEIAPDWVHPLIGKSVSAMLADLPRADRDAVRRL